MAGLTWGERGVAKERARTMFDLTINSWVDMITDKTSLKADREDWGGAGPNGTGGPAALGQTAPVVQRH